MRRFLLVFAVAVAARSAYAQAMKIGYVDVQQKRSDLDKKRADLEKMKTDYDKQAPVLSDEAKRQRQEQLQKAFVEAQNAAGQMQEELSGKEQEAMQTISKRLLQVVAELSDRENFTFVLDKAALLYAPAASDITNEVVRRYNERFSPSQAKAKAAPPAGKAAPPPPKK